MVKIVWVSTLTQATYVQQAVQKVWNLSSKCNLCNNKKSFLPPPCILGSWWYSTRGLHPGPLKQYFHPCNYKTLNKNCELLVADQYLGIPGTEALIIEERNWGSPPAMKKDFVCRERFLCKGITIIGLLYKLINGYMIIWLHNSVPRPSLNQNPQFTHKYIIQSECKRNDPSKRIELNSTVFKQISYQADAEGMAHHLPEKVLCSSHKYKLLNRTNITPSYK